MIDSQGSTVCNTTDAIVQPVTGQQVVVWAFVGSLADLLAEVLVSGVRSDLLGAGR